MSALAYIGPGVSLLAVAAPFLVIAASGLVFVLAVIWIVKREQRRERA